MSHERTFLYEIGASIGLKIEAKNKSNANKLATSLCAQLNQCRLKLTTGLKDVDIEYVVTDENPPDFLEELYEG